MEVPLEKHEDSQNDGIGWKFHHQVLQALTNISAVARVGHEDYKQPRPDLTKGWRSCEFVLSYRHAWGIRVVEDGTTDQTLLLCVPSSARKDYLREIHDGHWAGHRGVDKTYALARSKMWWPSLKKDIREHVRTCDTCQRNK